MSIHRATFGTTARGEPVELYTLQNPNGVQARIASYGGTLVSLRVPDRMGRLDDILLGFDTLEPYLSEHPYFGSLIGRHANRIAGASFTLDGKTYKLPANDGAHHLHGGPRGFHTVLWDAQPDETLDGPGVRLAYTSHDGEEGYPGELMVEVRYTLTRDDALRVDYVATADAATIVNLTNHAYFNLRGGGTMLDHVLTIAGAHFLPVSETLIPRGEALPVRDTPFDFTAPARIGERMAGTHEQFATRRGYDHCWVLDTGGSLARAAAELFDPASGRVMTVSTDQPGLQFYSGNFLDGTLRGKNGVAYERHAGLCLETQLFPDSPNQASFPSAVLRPGAAYRHTTCYRFSTR